MTNKIYDIIKKFIKNNYLILIIYGIIIFLFTFELDYEIYTPGGLSNLNERIEISNEYENEGTFNLTYVNAKKGIIPFVLLSKIIPDWDLVDLDDTRIEDEGYKDIVKRGQIDLENVNENAIKVAYEYAGKKYNYSKNDIVVYYVFNEAITNLKVGDIINKMDGKVIDSLDSISEVIESKSIGDKIKLNITRNGKEKEVSATIIESDDEKKIGLYLVNSIEVSTEDDIEFKYDKNEIGASGGLMSALEIYNSITSTDITKGKTISGTGTINIDGTVGEIGGVKYKLLGAVKNKADVFIVPTNNYEEAIKVKNERDLDITIIEASTFEGVLKSLEEL